MDESVAARVDQDGLWGFTGHNSPPPSPSLLPSCLPALSEWNVTLDKLVRSEKGSEEEEQLVRRAGEEVGRFVKNRWSEKEWETAWFVNPPVRLVRIICIRSMDRLTFCRDFKVCQGWHISMSSPDINRQRRSQRHRMEGI